MIGVVADEADQEVAEEFFELFKTPWELWRSDRHYEVVLCTTDIDAIDVGCSGSKLILLYSGCEIRHDARHSIKVQNRSKNGELSYEQYRIPIFGDSLSFPEVEPGILIDEARKQSAMQHSSADGRMVVRIGYSLFDEVRTLLCTGQPVEHAATPTLDLHIALLRDLIASSGAKLVEIPPIPEGYRFIVCLTHDVDHPSILNHRFDRTGVGFLYRATFGSLVNFGRGRTPLRVLLANWNAALKLPLVYLGICRDFWSGFEDRYLELERGLPSTFFVIPYKDRRGRGANGGAAPKIRAACYEAREIAGAIAKIKAAGCEVALHGIDAWIDSARGAEELDQIRRIVNEKEIGVRIHWLYYDEKSPEVLERACAAYDSTIGYRQTVGYRAGTTQVYKPLRSSSLLELPLHAMDTALFYPAYLGLSQGAATILLKALITNAERFGGCLTLNWHDRSLAPERMWDSCYEEILAELKKHGAWFATAGQAVSWFRRRRSASFTDGEVGAQQLQLSSLDDGVKALPGLTLRIGKATQSSGEMANWPDCAPSHRSHQPAESGARSKNSTWNRGEQNRNSKANVQ
jgi:peptidoglycan/xylan/chitin deacetylase (PgdA/CDA1 family)